uniref:Uncharacterized protein n=1 Tax=Otus sunia TaxID=257818 RepID=A0A8C8EF35_9STRI
PWKGLMQHSQCYGQQLLVVTDSCYCSRGKSIKIVAHILLSFGPQHVQQLQCSPTPHPLTMGLTQVRPGKHLPAGARS